jgi:hypothetical protein
VELEPLCLDEAVELYRLSRRLDSCIADDVDRSNLVEQEMIDLLCMIKDALDYHQEYDDAEDEDEKHEIGFQYSIITADIFDKLKEVRPYKLDLLHIH